MLLLWASVRVERKEIDDESRAEERQEGGTRSKIFFCCREISGTNKHKADLTPIEAGARLPQGMPLGKGKATCSDMCASGA